MPPDTRKVDLPQELRERNPVPTRGATPQELATPAGTGDGKLSEPSLLQDEQELRRIIDLIPQTIVVLKPDGKAIYANRAGLIVSNILYEGRIWPEKKTTVFCRIARNSSPWYANRSQILGRW